MFVGFCWYNPILGGLNLESYHVVGSTAMFLGSIRFLGTFPKTQHKNLYVAVCQNLVPLVNIKIAGKWMFIPLKMVLIGIDPYPCLSRRRGPEPNR